MCGCVGEEKEGGGGRGGEQVGKGGEKKGKGRVGSAFLTARRFFQFHLNCLCFLSSGFVCLQNGYFLTSSMGVWCSHRPHGDVRRRESAASTIRTFKKEKEKKIHFFTIDFFSPLISFCFVYI